MFLKIMNTIFFTIFIVGMGILDGDAVQMMLCYTKLIAIDVLEI